MLSCVGFISTICTVSALYHCCWYSPVSHRRSEREITVDVYVSIYRRPLIVFYLVSLCGVCLRVKYVEVCAAQVTTNRDAVRTTVTAVYSYPLPSRTVTRNTSGARISLFALPADPPPLPRLFAGRGKYDNLYIGRIIMCAHTRAVQSENCGHEIPFSEAQDCTFRVVPRPSTQFRPPPLDGHTTTAMQDIEYISPIEYTPATPAPPLPPAGGVAATFLFVCFPFSMIHCRTPPRCSVSKGMRGQS